MSFILLDCLIHIDRCHKYVLVQGLPVKISIKWCFSVTEDCFYRCKHADYDEMAPDVAVYLGLHCLPKYRKNYFRMDVMSLYTRMSQMYFAKQRLSLIFN